MKKLIYFLMMFFPSTAYAYDFQYNGIYYNVKDKYNNKVEVTCQKRISEYGEDGNENIPSGYYYSVNVDGDGNITSYTYCTSDYSGNISIPSSFTYNGKTYDVKAIGDFAFSNCSVTSITIPNSVYSIGDNAFGNCSATSITIPSSVTYIGDDAFSDCSATSIKILSSSIYYIGEGAFGGFRGALMINCDMIFKETYWDDDGVPHYESYFPFQRKSFTSLTLGDNVTAIPDGGAFSLCTSLTSVTIPNSVTTIGDEAFYLCSALTSVKVEWDTPVTISSSRTFSNSANATLYVPRGSKAAYQSANYWKDFKEIVEYEANISFTDANVKAICVQNWDTDGDGELSWEEAAVVSDLGTVFRDNTTITSFDELQYFTGLTSIRNNAFYGCSGLTSVTIPNSVTSIGNSAFGGSGLISITIPNTVTSIGENAFSYCKGTLTINCNIPYQPYVDTFSRWLNEAQFDKVIIGNSVTSIRNGAFSSLSSSMSSIIVESENTTYDSRENCNAIILKSENSLIQGCKNTVIPNTVTSIAESAFSGCGFTSLTIPESVIWIGSHAFSWCTGLTSMTIPNSVTNIHNGAFSHCSGLTSITLSNSLTEINQSLFWNCSNLTSITIPDNVKSIGKNAFCGCSKLTSVTIGNGVTSIGETAFTGCSHLEAVHISNLEAWFNIDFDYYGSIISNPLGYAHHLYLNGNELTDLVVPNSVSTIRPWAFKGCTGLTSVTIPSFVTAINNYAFQDCSNLTSVTVEMETPLTITEYTFTNRNNATLYVPAGCKAAYEAANYWKEFKAIVEMAPSTPVITFANANVKAICVQNWDTDGDGELSEAEAAAVTDLGTVFRQNKNITSFDELQYFTGLTSIGEEAFRGCSSLTSVTIPNGVTTIGNNAFLVCNGLTSVTIPESVTSIGNAAFSNCNSLTSIIVENGNSSFVAENGVLFNKNKTSLLCYPAGKTESTYTIPNSVTSIGRSAFNGCSKLTSVTIPSSVTDIGIYAFNGCSKLTSVTIPNSVTSIGNYAFNECSKLTSVDIPNSVTTLGYYAFYKCYDLTSVTIGNSVKSIGMSTFRYCNSLKSITIPNSVTRIDMEAFRGCTSLTSVTIPESVTSLGTQAFRDCSALTSVKVGMESPLTIDSEAFTNRANTTLYIPKGCKSAYQAANYWKEFKAIKEFPDSDVNQDGEIDMMDVVDIARFVVGTPAETFVEFLADLNNNGEVNVADAVVLVNEIVGDQNFAKAFGAPQTAPVGDDRLTLTKNDDHSLSFSMESQRNYTAFQFDLYTNSEDDVMGLRLNTARKHGHQLIYNKVDEGHYRVVALSVANNTFNGNSGELLNIQLDGFNSADMTISNIHFITTDGTDYRFDNLTMSGATGIDGLTPNLSPKEEGNVYDLSGRKVSVPSVLPKGVYIVNGKKVIAK